MTAPRLYGPHDPRTAPSTVVVFGRRGMPDYHVQPHASLVRQRQNLNSRAHQAAVDALREEATN